MESKEYITYSRRAKAAERRQQSLVKNNQFNGYRSTKQWVEETSQQRRGGLIEKAEQQQQQQYRSEGVMRALNVTPCRTSSRKKDGRGVHFKQENDQTSLRLKSKVGNQPSSLLHPAIVRKDGFLDSQAAALSPISLNVAVGFRQVASAPIPAKHSAGVATLPTEGSQTQSHISVISPDGRLKTLPSGGRDEEGRQVVWCNAAFEADDDLRSQDSVRSNRYSPASCSKNVEGGVCGPVTVPSMDQKEQDQPAGASGSSHVIADPAESNIFFSSAAISAATAVAGSSPATVTMKSPEQDSSLPHIAQLELDSAAGEWFTLMGSEGSSHTSRGFAQGNGRPMDPPKARRNLSATLSFKTVTPQTPSHPNRPVPETRIRSASCCNSRKYPKYCPPEIQSNCESAGRKNPNLRTCISFDNGPRSAKRTGGAPILATKVDPLAFNFPRNCPPEIQRFQEDPKVEADLEADIEHEIEQEISMEILQLSERLAALHAKQETRRVGGGGGVQEKSKTGGISCPHTPLRNAPSPCGSDAAEGKRKGRVVAAKFLQCTNDGSNVKRDKSVTRTERPMAKSLGFIVGPFHGRPNPPRRSLGTPSRLLTKGKPNGQQRSGSPNHIVKERMMEEEQYRGTASNKVTIDEYMRSRAMIENGSRRIARVLTHKNVGEEDRKEWDDRGICPSKKKENHPAPVLCTGSTAVQPNFYPEFEQKVDWVKTLRTDPIPPAAHPSGATNPPTAPALDERFLKQRPERQDVNAWLRENIGVAGNCEIPNSPGTAIYDAGLQGRRVQADTKKLKTAEEEDSTNSRSTRPSNGLTSSLSNARTATPNRCTPIRPATPSRGNARTVPSRYGTPVKAVPARDPRNNNKPFEAKPIMEKYGAKPWYSQTTPGRRYSNDTQKAGLLFRKASPTIRKGYPGESAVVSGSKDIPGVLNNDVEVSRGERKITIVGGSEYEKFVQEEGVVIETRVPAVCKTLVVDGGQSGQGVRSKTPCLIRQREMCEPPSSSAPAKTIFIRCSDLIKGKHSMLVKGKQRRLAGQGVLPSDSDDSVFARSNTRTDFSELDGENSRSEDASNIEEITYIQNSQLSQRRAGEGMISCSRISDKSSLTPDYDIVYDYESGTAGVSSYRPEDYTLEMMLQYVDTLKCEREALPRIRAVKDAATGSSSSPRDSGGIKRRKESEKRNRFYFNAGGEANKVQVPKCTTMENDGLSPNEIEGLDLESFWCLVGELPGW